MKSLTINHVAIASALALHVLLLVVQFGSKPVTHEAPARIAIRLIAPPEPKLPAAVRPEPLSRPVVEIDNQKHKQPAPLAKALNVAERAETPAALPAPELPLSVAAPTLTEASAPPAATPAAPETLATPPAPAAVVSPEVDSRLSEYLLIVRSQVENHKNYPSFARQLRQQGTVLVRVSIGLDGRLRDAVILTSSGHASLDKAALAAVRSAGRFRSPEGFGLSRDVTVDIPVTYKLI